jgi:predicted ArsR family transcriptional regulator
MTAGAAPPPTAVDGLDAIASLGEPTRRAVYDFVVAANTWVSRDRAAEATGLERATAAHHLDRLATDGLLEVDYRRLSGRRGPGAGRPSKVYRRSPVEVAVSLPRRDYELAGRVLAAAIELTRADEVDITDAVEQAARSEGRRLGEVVRSHLPAGRSRGAARRAAAIAVLAAQGFEPRDDHGVVVLQNCPFHHLAQQHRELICAMNHCLVGTALEAAEGTGLEARLEPEEGQCCVRLHPARRAAKRR